MRADHFNGQDCVCALPGALNDVVKLARVLKSECPCEAPGAWGQDRGNLEGDQAADDPALVNRKRAELRRVKLIELYDLLWLKLSFLRLLLLLNSKLPVLAKADFSPIAPSCADFLDLAPEGMELLLSFNCLMPLNCIQKPRFNEKVKEALVLLLASSSC